MKYHGASSLNTKESAMNLDHLYIFPESLTLFSVDVSIIRYKAVIKRQIFHTSTPKLRLMLDVDLIHTLKTV